MRTYEHDTVIAAQQRLEAAVLNVLQARHYSRPEDPHADAAMDLADDELAMAARDLTRAVERMPAADRPIGWDEHSHGPFSTVPEVAR